MNNSDDGLFLGCFKLNDISFGSNVEDVCTRIMRCDYHPQRSAATTKAVAEQIKKNKNILKKRHRYLLNDNGTVLW